MILVTTSVVSWVMALMSRYLVAPISKYTWIAYTAAKSNVAYISEVGSRVIFLGVILYIFLKLWQVTFRETGATNLGGLTLPQMMWYLAVTESIMLSTPLVSQAVDRDVRTGQLAVHLIKPLSYPLYCLGNALGERLTRFSLNLAVGLLVVTIFVGPIPLSWQSVALLGALLPLAFTLDFLAYFLIGLGAFWLEDTVGLVLIYSRVTMILGGMLIPMELFPEQLQPWLRVLPFANVVYGPARMFVKPDFEALPGLVLNQLVSISVYTILVVVVYRLATRRIFSNGG